MHTILVALSILILVVLSPLLPDIVNLFRPQQSKLYSTDELYDAYDWFLFKIFKCSVCQALWATVFAVLYTDHDNFIACVLNAYPAVFVLWLGIKYLYAKTNIY